MSFILKYLFVPFQTVSESITNLPHIMHFLAILFTVLDKQYNRAQ